MTEKVTALPQYATVQRFGPANAHRNIHFHVAMAGTPIERLAAPDYWKHVATKVNPLDRIEVTTDDGSYFAELIVLSSNPIEGLRLAPLRGIELHGQVAPVGASARNPAGIRAVYRGPHLKWSAMRGDEVMRDKFESEGACNQWIAGHTRAQHKGKGPQS